MLHVDVCASVFRELFSCLIFLPCLTECRGVIRITSGNPLEPPEAVSQPWCRVKRSPSRKKRSHWFCVHCVSHILSPPRSSFQLDTAGCVYMLCVHVTCMFYQIAPIVSILLVTLVLQMFYVFLFMCTFMCGTVCSRTHTHTHGSQPQTNSHKYNYKLALSNTQRYTRVSSNTPTIL